MVIQPGEAVTWEEGHTMTNLNIINHQLLPTRSSPTPYPESRQAGILSSKFEILTYIDPQFHST